MFRVLDDGFRGTKEHRKLMGFALVRDNYVEVVDLEDDPNYRPFVMDQPCCTLLSVVAPDGGEFMAAFNRVPGCVRALVSIDSREFPRNAPRFRGSLVANVSRTPTLGVLERRGAVLEPEAWVGNFNVEGIEARDDKDLPDCR